MAYGSAKGRKPFERASKAAHSSVINEPEVRALIARCYLPEAPPESDVRDMCIPIPTINPNPIRAVIAVDGGYTETTVRDRFPSSSVTFFSLGPLLFSLSDLRSLERQPFIAPEDIAILKNIERYSLALPTRNVRLATARGLSDSVRRAVFEFLSRSTMAQTALIDSLRWLLLREWSGAVKPWTIPNCPNPGCTATDITFDQSTGNEVNCPDCKLPVYLSDAMRLHERIDEEQGAAGICSYLMTGLEQIVIVHSIRTVLTLKRDLLRELLLIKDGPLAFFGVTAPLSRPMRELTSSLSEQGLHLLGLEKSGTFVDHAAAIETRMPLGSLLIPSNEYIYKFIEPGDPTVQQYGRNTYYGTKAIYRTGVGDVYVLTAPTPTWSATPQLADIPNLVESLNVLADLRCSMYENALLPIALANRLVSLSDVPSKEILTVFAKKMLDVPVHLKA